MMEEDDDDAEGSFGGSSQGSFEKLVGESFGGISGLASRYPLHADSLG